MPRPETGSVRAENPSWQDKAAAAREDDDHGDHGPVVRQWRPADDRPPQAAPVAPRMEDDDDQGTKCPDGTKMNGLTGICDSAPVEGDSFIGSITSSMPSGYGSVLAASAGSL